MDIRIGLGIDRHCFVEGAPLILAGLRIPHSHGLKGHSDADAVLHALSDALLGALALGDIGEFFPDTDPQWQGVSSEKILSACHQKIRDQGWMVGNVDIVIETEFPKIGPHRQAMRDHLASLLETSPENISVKAKTAEKLGPVGRHECLDVRSVVLLKKSL